MFPSAKSASGSRDGPVTQWISFTGSSPTCAAMTASCACADLRDEMMQTTNPYYFTTYVMVYRSDKGLAIDGIADRRLASLRLGVVSATPPSNLLVRHDLMAHAKPYPLTVATRAESPPHQMILDVMSGAIDVGFLWGPIAGYYKKHDKLPLSLVPLKDEPGAPRMKYHIAMGVRANEPEWRRRGRELITGYQPRPGAYTSGAGRKAA